MKLTYSILWFDDNESFFDGLDLDYLRDEIQKWGFSPRIVQVTTDKDFKSHEPYDAFDLLVVDYELEQYGHGQEFIAQLREHQVFTEVIFYSAGDAGLLWKAIHDRKLEGVYVANKGAVGSKILRVGHQSIRKVLDLENMRGIVMAEVAELDLLLDSILARAIDGLPEEAKSEFFKRFHKSATEQADQHSALLAVFSETPTTEILMQLSGSAKRWHNFNRLKKLQERLAKAAIGDYEKDIVHPRNHLAHGIAASHSETGGTIFRFSGKEYHFDNEVSIKLRHTIMEYKSAFEQILTDLK